MSKKGDWQKERREKLKQAGLCLGCGKCPPRDGLTRCEICALASRSAVAKHKNAVREQRNLEGLCKECGSPKSIEKKLCEVCRLKALERYYENKANGACAYCANPSIPGKTRCEACVEKAKAKKHELRMEAFNAYGGAVCNCCGENIHRFLTIDHTNNDGKKHRDQIGRTRIYSWLKANNFPAGFQVLCYNCNCGRQLNGGICPHKQN